MKLKLSCQLLLFSFMTINFPGKLHSQEEDTLRIATYNLFELSASGAQNRAADFRMIINEIDPDILVVQEMNSAVAQTAFLNEILNKSDTLYEAGPFSNGPDTDNGIFFKKDKLQLVEANQIFTGLAFRDISEYVLSVSGNLIVIYSVHFSDGTSATNQQNRLIEATALSDHLSALPDTAHFIVVGTFNAQRSTEGAFSLLADEMQNEGILADPVDQIGNWHDSGTFKDYHTESTRVPFKGEGLGGLDDRFDFLLVSQNILTTNSVSFLPGSYTTFGNDGNHLNVAVNFGINTAVSPEIAEALNRASDHLPVYADFIFRNVTSVQNQSHVPSTFVLRQNYPNPFNPFTNIEYDLPTTFFVVLKIYNTLGEEIKTLVHGIQPTGSHNIVWDGKNNSGTIVGSGLYIFTLNAGTERQSRKMLFIK